MTNVIYTMLSRQSALSRELTDIANNVANSDTAGYQRQGAFYSEYVNALGPDTISLSQTRIGGQYFDPKQGALTRTGGDLDFSINGRGYFVVDTPRGERLTRAGAFQLNAEREIVTPQGYRLLGDGGAPIAVPPNAVRIELAEDGTLSADGAPLGKIQIVATDQTALSREGENMLRAEGALTPIENVKITQGFIEDSNINVALEITRLIEVQRAYERGQQLIKSESDRITRAIESFSQRR